VSISIRINIIWYIIRYITWYIAWNITWYIYKMIDNMIDNMITRMNLALHKNRHNHREAPEPPQRLRCRSPEVHHGVRQGERCLGGNGQEGDPQRAKTSRHLRWLQELLGSWIIFVYVYMVLKNFNGSSTIHVFINRDMIVIRVWHQSALRLETRLTRLTLELWVLWKQPEWVVLWSVFWFLSE
jgi:hypothetical protein